jgi:anti-sigma B factor antagonist
MIEVTEETRGGWVVVGVKGRADAEAADQLEAALRSAVEQHSKVAADFGSLDYISSAGLRAVLQAARTAQMKDVEFAVCGMSPPVKKVFGMSGMQHLLTIHGELPC